MRINQLVLLFVFLVGICFGLFLQIRHSQIQKLLPPTPTPTRIYMKASNTNIFLDSPGIEEPVGNRFAVRGRARVFENMIMIRVKNKKTNQEYLVTSSYADAPDVGQFGEFTYIVDLKALPNLPPPQLQKGEEITLEVYHNSARDGSEADKLSVPLLYDPAL